MQLSRISQEKLCFLSKSPTGRCPFEWGKFKPSSLECAGLALTTRDSCLLSSTILAWRHIHLGLPVSETNTLLFFSFKSLQVSTKYISVPHEGSVSGQQVWRQSLPTWKFSENLSTEMPRERQMPPITSPQPNKHRLARLTNTDPRLWRTRFKSGQKLNHPCVFQLTVKSLVPS